MTENYARLKKLICAGVIVAVSSVGGGLSTAAADTIVASYFDAGTPFDAAIAKKRFEKELGEELGVTVEWKQFKSGAYAVNAMLGGSVDIAWVGSPPAAVAISKGVPADVIWVLDLVGTAEGLAARANITSVQDLIGQKIGVSFGSTTQYSLMKTLEHYNVSPNQVELLNMGATESLSAFVRGDIAAAYVENPSLGEIVKAGGKVLVYSGDVAKWGYPTMDLLMVRRDYGKQHPEVVARFLKILAEVTNEAIKDPADTSETLSAFLSISKQEASDMLAGYVFPTIEDQLSATWFGGSNGPSAMAKALQATAQFTKDQGEIDTVLPDYSVGVDGSYMEEAKRLLGAQ